MLRKRRAALCLILALLFTLCACSDFWREPLTRVSTDPGGAAVQNAAAVTFSVGGDMLIHNTVYSAAQTASGYDFKPFFSLFTDIFNSDFNIINAETPIDVYGGNKNLSSYPMFNAPREVAEGIRFLGADIAITANNHCMDKGFAGLLATRENLRAAGLIPFGTYGSEAERAAPYIDTSRGLAIGFLAYAHSTNGIPVPAQHAGYAVRHLPVTPQSAQEILKDVQALQAKGADAIVLSYHWGAEYADAPDAAQKEMARTLLEGGVDVIVGSHSHCVQPMELVETSRGTRLVIYSLGNLFADQIALGRLKTQAGLVAHFTLEKKEGVLSVEDVSYTPTYTYRNNQKQGSARYRLLPGALYIEETTRPAVFATDADFTTYKDAYAHVTRIVGTQFPLR